MSVSRRVRFAVLTRDRFTCRYCGRSAPGVELQVDHVYPASRGGSDKIENLVAACRDCNASKSDKVLPPMPRPIPPEQLVAVEATPQLKLLAHPDRCNRCRNIPYAEAFTSIDTETGYYAFYECDHCGHCWRTYWAAEHRMTVEDAERTRSTLWEVAP
ncbi:MAG TPA: HNH endonuclease [Gemmatimonadaceae bacterium]|jgi:5-methylcytosine-specific restriction endonuclease McrA